jgi:hypothetical protein
LIKEELRKKIFDTEYEEKKVRKMVQEVRVGKDKVLRIERK